jgi:hypothetical protein
MCGPRVAQEEIFGPVVTVTTFETEEEAIAIANSSEYGLFAGIYTRDSERALRVARRIDVGVVLINNYFRGILGLPFGGTKHSGYGREHTIETLAHFGYRKLIRFPSGTGTWPQWRAVGEIFWVIAKEHADGRIQHYGRRGPRRGWIQALPRVGRSGRRTIRGSVP